MTRGQEAVLSLVLQVTIRGFCNSCVQGRSKGLHLIFSDPGSAIKKNTPGSMFSKVLDGFFLLV